MNLKITTILGGFLFVLWSVHAYGQEKKEINTDFQKERASLFSKLEVERIPHGILLDYGFDFTSMEFYEGGKELQEKFFSSKEDVRAVYKTMLSSTIGKLPAEFIHPDSLFSRWDYLRNAQQVVLSGSFTRYSRFVEEVSIKDKIDVKDNVILDRYVKGIWQNPYLESQSFVLAPPINSYKGKKLTVTVPRELFITNETDTIRLAIDFNDGNNYQNVAWNRPINVEYGTEGDKIWRYRLTTSSGVYYAQSKMKIIDWLRPVPVSPSGGQYCSPNSVVSVPIRASKPYLGKYATVDVTVACSGDGVIRKPLIVIEGFDVGNLLDPENEFGMTDYTTFKKSFEFIEDSNLADLLLNGSREYDVFYINWRNGVDYMQRNAYAVQEVIRWVNSIKVGNEPNVVLGQSMGGVIGRYALADMEERNMNHDTRLFISHDAPHLGANVPLSVQYMYRDLTQQYLELDNRGLGILLLSLFLDSEGRQQAGEISRLLDQPAARQLIKNWVNSSYQVDNAMHTRFYNELRAKGINQNGYPIKSRNIALSNGSQCGNPQDNLRPGDALIDFDFDLKPGLFLSMLTDIVNPIAFLFGAGATGNGNFVEAAFLSSLPGSSRYIAEIKARANYDQATQNIYYSTLKYKKKILWVVNSQKTISSRSQNQPAGILPFEYYGGGYFQIYEDNQARDFQGNQYYDLAVKQRFNFVPTPSALDIGNYRQTNLYSDDYTRSYTTSTDLPNDKKSPFDSFITDYDIYSHQSINTRHISFNSRNANWLAQELNKVQKNPSCNFICALTDDESIQGNTLLCQSESYHTALDAEHYEWSLVQGGDLVQLVKVNDKKVTLSMKGVNKKGLVVLQVKLASAECGERIVKKKIWVGPPGVFAEVHHNPQVWSSKHIEVTSGLDMDLFKITRVEWNLNSKYGVGTGLGASGLNGIASGSDSKWGVNVTIKVHNACGVTILKATASGGYGDMGNQIPPRYPKIVQTINPDEYEVMSTIEDENGKISYESLHKEDQVELYVHNLAGQLMRTIKEAKVSLYDLPKGTYILNAFVNSQEKAELTVYKK